ncbi:MAG: NitT/TauT family transport system ATP-binding protein [Solirubrobacteraceae bacterium]
MTAKLEVRNLTKVYFGPRGSTVALKDVSFDVRAGEFMCICGPSGCGKSTLFNIIAGLDTATGGAVSIEGRDVTTAMRGHVSYMFQKDLLVPWRTVAQNVALSLEVKGVRKRPALARAQEYVERYGFADFADAFPKSLSGGMRQRVALMRTLALESDVILMDEPFASLDYPTKLAIETELRGIVGELGKTVLFVTHDIEEAVSLGDRVMVLSGRPGSVRKIHDVDLFGRTGSVVQARGAEGFREMFNAVWSELDTTTEARL